jgi:hypothetical protein
MQQTAVISHKNRQDGGRNIKGTQRPRGATDVEYFNVLSMLLSSNTTHPQKEHLHALPSRGT